MEPMGYALVGCGAFGRYCLAAQRSNLSVRALAVSDVDAALARSTSEEFGVPVRTFEEVLADPAIEFVHLATPPWTHRELGERALRAGKHLLCEKPLATSIEDANFLLALAEEKGLRLMVNLIMRYTPVVGMVSDVIATGALGAPIRASFENDAQDEPLGPSHWFWDREKSGGIFVEHAVHFFDLFESWFGPGEVVAAAAGSRPDGREDRVHAVTRHAGNVLVTQTHAFTQAKPMDRQTWRLVFSRGEIWMTEWIPTSLLIDGWFTGDEAAALGDLPLDRMHHEEPSRTSVNYGEHRPDAWRGTWIGEGGEKAAIYEDAVRELATDLVRSVRDPAHVRRVTERNGRDSLATALRARSMS